MEDSNSETDKVRKTLQFLRKTLDKHSVLEGIVAGIIAAQNFTNLGRPIGLINLGRNMIQEMEGADRDTEIIVYSNLLGSVLSENKENNQLLPGFKNVNHNCIDQYLRNRPNKREIKEMTKITNAEYSQYRGLQSVMDTIQSPYPVQLNNPRRSSFIQNQPSSESSERNLNPYMASYANKPQATIFNALKSVKSEERSAPVPVNKVMLPNFSPEKPSPFHHIETKSPQDSESVSSRPISKPTGRKKPVVRKNKPAANSRVIHEEKREECKIHSNARTEIWDWQKIQENALNDHRLSQYIHENGDIVTLS